MKIIVKLITYASLVASGVLIGMVCSRSSNRKVDVPGAPSVSTKQELASTHQPSIAQIKGNCNSKGELIYHVPGGQYYNRVKGQELFHTEEEAQQAGYRRSLR